MSPCRGSWLGVRAEGYPFPGATVPQFERDEFRNIGGMHGRWDRLTYPRTGGKSSSSCTTPEQLGCHDFIMVPDAGEVVDLRA